jgi:hypothetical protein
MTKAMNLRRELETVGAATFTARDYRPGKTVHIVLFKFRPEVSPAALAEVTKRFRALRSSVREDGEPYILAIDSGPQASGEGNDGAGYDVGFVVTFASEGDRNFYVGDPIQPDPRYFDHAHAAFKDFVGPLLADGEVLVFDIVSAADARNGAPPA